MPLPQSFHSSLQLCTQMSGHVCGGKRFRGGEGDDCFKMYVADFENTCVLSEVNYWEHTVSEFCEVAILLHEIDILLPPQKM